MPRELRLHYSFLESKWHAARRRKMLSSEWGKSRPGFNCRVDFEISGLGKRSRCVQSRSIGKIFTRRKSLAENWFSHRLKPSRQIPTHWKMAIELGTPLRVSPLIKASWIKRGNRSEMWCNCNLKEQGEGDDGLVWEYFLEPWFSAMKVNCYSTTNLWFDFSSAAGHSSPSVSLTELTTRTAWPSAKLESEPSRPSRKRSATWSLLRRRPLLLLVS